MLGARHQALSAAGYQFSKSFIWHLQQHIGHLLRPIRLSLEVYAPFGGEGESLLLELLNVQPSLALELLQSDAFHHHLQANASNQQALLCEPCTL